MPGEYPLFVDEALICVPPLPDTGEKQVALWTMVALVNKYA